MSPIIGQDLLSTNPYEQYDVARFAWAQEAVRFGSVLRELGLGFKTGHWTWFVFPQLRGLGGSEMSWFYGLDGGGEAVRYMCDPTLGYRYVQACGRLLALPGPMKIEYVLGDVDALKLRSSLTLFDSILTNGATKVIVDATLERFFDGKLCRRTVDVLTKERSS